MARWWRVLAWFTMMVTKRKLEVKYGSIEILRWQNGQSAKLTLQPSHGTDDGLLERAAAGMVRVTGAPWEL